MAERWTNIFLILFLAGTVLDFIVNFILERIDYNFRQSKGREIPGEVAEFFDAETVEKTVLYENAGYSLWVPEAFVSCALGIYLVLCGYYPFCLDFAVSLSGDNFYFAAICFLLLSEVPAFILAIPFSLIKEFNIEKKFGFSKMTLGMWIGDLIKSVIVGTIIMSLLVSAIILAINLCGAWWWLMAGAVYLAFSLGLGVLWPIFIAPLFNKFTPLEDGELKDRLENLLKKCGFESKGLFVMDASRRSGHSNAYFTGFGKSKRVVLFDTLIEQMTPAEIESVLGHELGHYKHHHIIKRMIVMVPMIFAVLFAASLLVSIPELYMGFGFDAEAASALCEKGQFFGLFFLTFVVEGADVIISPVTNYFSRRDEFQADAYAKEICGTGEHLISALIKLNKENLHELQVPEVYSLFNYSHPPLLERIEALKK